MIFKEMTDNQRRVFIDTIQLHEAFVAVFNKNRSYRGGMHWKKSKGHEYLFRSRDRFGYGKNFKKIERSKALRCLNLSENGFYLGFLGNVWRYYDLSNILKAMKLCQEEITNLHMIMIGSGPETDKLRTSCRCSRRQRKVYAQ